MKNSALFQDKGFLLLAMKQDMVVTIFLVLGIDGNPCGEDDITEEKWCQIQKLSLDMSGCHGSMVEEWAPNKKWTCSSNFL
ncbi:hypothetical protein RJT34_14729 [Clitoria ternatea]|uniref:Uncharacterized protein n=1 Tax=Clitoria ternatea TaxID=43366 RepID=A0AAN9PNE4_CLITE